MNYNLNKCIEHLNRGIDLKRQNKNNEAIREYELAIGEFPTYKHIYYNLAKIYLTFVETNGIALKNFLTYAHLSIVQENVNEDNTKIIQENGFYSFNGEYIPGIQFSENTCYELIKANKDFGVIFSDINLTFNVGLTYILRDQTLIKYHNIDRKLISNHINMISGRKEVEGIILGDSKFAPLIHITGLLFIIKNIVYKYNSLDIPEDEIITIYLSKNYNIDLL